MSNRQSFDRAVIGPVFFAVVPDSFMNREGSGRPVSAGHAERSGWSPEDERPLVRPYDRWAF